MCGIVGAVARRDVTPDLLSGLYRLEYRGYDSAGMAVLNGTGAIQRLRVAGKITGLEEALKTHPGFAGTMGIAHTRWATHGRPSEENAHPHVDGGNSVAVVHNGIIENHESLRQRLRGCRFTSETDTEMIAHLAGRRLLQTRSPLKTLQRMLGELQGSYALGLILDTYPGCIFAARRGSPLVIGFSADAHYIASDVMALLPLTSRFTVLEDGDAVLLKAEQVCIFDATGREVQRPVFQSDCEVAATAKGGYRHYMQKEIHEQPAVMRATLERVLIGNTIDPSIFGTHAEQVLAGVEAVQVVACGTSYHAGLVGARWIEELAGLPCRVEVASEFRHRRLVVPARSLLVAISQSGETADTLAAVRHAKDYPTRLAICNVPQSALVRTCELQYMTDAGAEIGVASTKAFTSQLLAMQLLALLLARRKPPRELKQLPTRMEDVLALDINPLVQQLAHARSALYMGRGQLLPIAMEGALKLKEISYIHAEAYPAGELKHGPLALVDDSLPVIAPLAADTHQDRLKANLEEILARGGRLLLFVQGSAISPAARVSVCTIPSCPELLAPILFTVPLQRLAYQVAVQRGADVDQPRNLAKSVTVE